MIKAMQLKFSSPLAKWIICGMVVFVTIPATGQYNYANQYTYRDFDVRRTSELSLSINSISFVKNNEYSGLVTEGYTLIGYDMEPSVVYYAGDRLRLQAGVHVQRYSGLDEFSQVLPLFSAHLHLNPWLGIVMGALKGNIHHRLPEPLFEPERQFTRPIEAGIQALIDKPRFWLDTWVDWEQFVQAGDAFPEKFTFGLSTRSLFADSLARWQITLPFSVVATHTGGQISNYPEPVQTITNASLGLHVDRQWFGYVKRAGLFGYHFQYRNLSEKNRLGINSGHAWYAGAVMEGRTGNAMLGFFRGNDFIAPLGSALFQSVSTIDETWHLSPRELIVGKLDYHKTFLKKIKLTFRFETYYDTGLKHLDFANTLQLTFTPDFFLAKVSFF